MFGKLRKKKYAKRKICMQKNNGKILKIINKGNKKSNLYSVFINLSPLSQIFIRQLSIASNCSLN